MSARLLPAELLRDSSSAGHFSGWSALANAAEASPRRQAEGTAPHAASAPAGAFEQELASVQAELQRVRQQAESSTSASYRSGFDDGVRQGLAKNQAELDSFRSQIATTLRSAEIARREMLEHSDAELVKLSIAIAEKILNRQIQIDPNALQGLVKSALERLAGKPVQCVRIHPEDRPVIESALAPLSGKRAIRTEADASLARGSLHFDTDFGTLDGSVTTQLEEIETGLVDRLRRSGQ